MNKNFKIIQRNNYVNASGDQIKLHVLPLSSK